MAMKSLRDIIISPQVNMCLNALLIRNRLLKRGLGNCLVTADIPFMTRSWSSGCGRICSCCNTVCLCMGRERKTLTSRACGKCWDPFWKQSGEDWQCSGPIARACSSYQVVAHLEQTWHLSPYWWLVTWTMERAALRVSQGAVISGVHPQLCLGQWNPLLVDWENSDESSEGLHTSAPSPAFPISKREADNIGTHTSIAGRREVSWCGVKDGKSKPQHLMKQDARLAVGNKKQDWTGV